jgi:type IV pilus assembly protein PilM
MNGPATNGATGTPVDGPSGPGWVIELHGYHYYKDGLTYGPAHVRSTLMAALEEGTVELPEESFDRDVDNAERRSFTMKELGIAYPILVIDQFDRTNRILNPNYEEPRTTQGIGIPGVEHGPGPGPGPMPDPAKPEKIEPRDYAVPKYTFSVQFVWQEKRLNERIKTQKEKEEAAKKAAEAAAQNVSAPATGPGPAPAGPLPVTPTGAAS